MTPTQRTLAKLRKDGWTAAVTEHWNAHAHIRQDLFGFIDIVAFCDSETLAVQATSYAGVSARIKKLRALDTVRDWCAGGRRCEIWGWRKGVRGERALRIVDMAARAAGEGK